MKFFIRGVVVFAIMMILTFLSCMTLAQSSGDTITVKYISKKLDLATGKAKLSFMCNVKKTIIVRFYDSHNKLVAVLPKLTVSAKVARTVYWNGRKRFDDGKGYGDYVAAGNYRAKISGAHASVFSKKIQVVAGPKQVFSKVTISKSGFVGEKTIKVSFCIAYKQDVVIRLINKDGKAALIKKLRDVKPKAVNIITVSGRANKGNELGLENGTPLMVGDYKVSISSNRTNVVRSIRLLEHFSPINQFIVNNTDDTYVASWDKIDGALGYEVKILRIIDNIIMEFKAGESEANGKIFCKITNALVSVGAYRVEVYAFGDSFHPITKVGTFNYFIYGKLLVPKNLMFIKDNGLVSAYCDPVENADCYIVSVYFNTKLVNTFELSNSSKQDISESIRLNGYGQYTFSIVAKSKKNKCYTDSDSSQSSIFEFKGLKSPTDVTVTIDSNGNYLADWSDIEGVEYYVLSLYVKGKRVMTFVCGLSETTLTAYVPNKGESYEVDVYSMGNQVYSDSMVSERFQFKA